MKDYPLDRSITLGVNRWYCLKAFFFGGINFRATIKTTGEFGAVWNFKNEEQSHD